MSFLTYFLFFFISSAFAQFKIYWQNGGNNDTSRITDLKSINVPGFASGLYYYSLDTPSGGANGVFGAAYSFDGPLVSYLTYFNVSGDWAGAANPGSSANVNKAVALIGAAYIALNEVDPNNGTTLSTVMMRDLSWNVSQVQTEPVLKYATFTGTGASIPNFSISFTFVVSNTSVTLTTGSELTNTSVECVINILNFPFISNTSKLNLTIGVATATMGNVSNLVALNGQQRLDANGVYWSGGKSVLVDVNGTSQPVGMFAMNANSTDFGGAGFVDQCNQMKQAQPLITVNWTLIQIMFPHAMNLTYDPAVGVNVLPNGTITATGGNTGCALTVHFSLFTLLMAAVLMKLL